MNIRSRALIEIAIEDFATPEQKEILDHWAKNHSDLNQLYASIGVRIALLQVLNQRLDFLRSELKSPWIAVGELDYLIYLMGSIETLIEEISVSEKSLYLSIDGTIQPHI